jgi:hypothetical protein
LDEGDSKRFFEIAYFDNANKMWGEPIKVIRADHFGKSDVNVLWESSGGFADLGREPFTLADFHCFGRIQGTAADLVTFSLLAPNRGTDFFFSQKSIENLKKTLEKLDLEPGYSILKIAGDTTYDEDATALILETKVEDKMSQRYWVDRSRGYVCPLIQYYDDGRLVEEYKSSNYIQHAQTGLWYPTVHVETKYSPNTGKMIEQREFQVNSSTLQLNQAVNENEFFIDIPEGVNVIDRRTPKSEVRYISTEKGTLSLAKGGLDLDKMSWLYKEEKVDFTLRPAVWDAKRYVLMSIGILLILIWLFLMWRKRRAKGL